MKRAGYGQKAAIVEKFAGRWHVDTEEARGALHDCCVTFDTHAEALAHALHEVGLTSEVQS